MHGRRKRVFIGVATALLLTLGPVAVNGTAYAAATGTLEGTVRDAANNAGISGATVSSDGASATTGADGHYSLQLPAGDHTVTASAYGYGSGTASVTIVDGGTTGQDFSLTVAGSVTLSGKVTDGSGHGWPLYARLDITGRPGGPVFTNPFTGKYSVSIAAGATYSVKVTPLINGYQTVTANVAVGTGDKTQNFSAPVGADCTAPGYTQSVSAPIFSETFDAATAPAGWTVTTATSSPGWAFDDPGARGNLTGGEGGFAIADSDHAGQGSTTDTTLVTPVLDFSTALSPQLSFNSDFRDIGSDDFTDVDVTTDGGTNWRNLYHQVDSRRGPTVETVSLAAVGGQAAVQLRFHYRGTWDWWWQVDNVSVVNRLCTPVPGGLVEGFTTDKNTGDGLNGVKVTHDENPSETATSAGTPDDMTQGDGFYYLFTRSTGAQNFTATKDPYLEAQKAATVAADSVVRADFALKAGRVTVSPTSIEIYQTLGQTRSTTLSLTNNGSAATRVDFSERSSDPSTLRMSGAQLKTVKVPDKVSRGYKPFKNRLDSSGKATASALVDAAWTNLPSTPQPISDNAAANVGGKAYSFGGGASTGNEKKAFVYDPEARAWTTLPDMPNARSKPSAVTIGTSVYVFGGWDTDGTPLASTDVFNTSTNTWSTLPTANPSPVSAAGAGLAAGAVYLVGGCLDGDCTDTANVTKYDIASGTFSPVAPYPHPVAWLSCGGIADKVYCAGGAADASFTDGFVYDPASNAWSPIADLPVDLWGAQYASAGGRLVIAGGIANDSSEITNQTVGYDPNSNTWQNLPNATYPRARGAAACGVYKIGGWSGPFTPAGESEQLDGVGPCDAGTTTGDVPWLSENPEGVALAAGQTKTVKVTLTATPATGINQPGDYTAQIVFDTHTPYAVAPVDVTMHVLPPASWGKIQGTVTGTPCGGANGGIPAYIQVTSTTDATKTWSVRASGSGIYSIWLPKDSYQVIAAKDGWTPKAASAKLTAGLVVTINFELAPFNACK
jgi:hypothetical protein